MMTPSEILNEIKRLPPEEKEKIFKSLETELQYENGGDDEEIKEREIERMLVQKGLIKGIPENWNDDDEDFEPITVTGKPLSETIIEDRG